VVDLLTPSDVLAMMAPVDPDKLQRTQDGGWAAFWMAYKSNPDAEREIAAVRANPRFQVLEEKSFSGLLAVHHYVIYFTIREAPNA
jgi:hypothetical protein